MAWYDIAVKAVENTGAIILADVTQLPTYLYNRFVTPTEATTAIDGASFADGSMSQKITDAGLNNLLLSPFTKTTMINSDGSFSKAPYIYNQAGKTTDAVDAVAKKAASTVSSTIAPIALVGGLIFLALEMSKGGRFQKA